MSYILAALKKSEQERDKLEGDSGSPSDALMSLNSSAPPHGVDAKPNSIVLVGMLFLVCLTLLFAFLLFKSTGEQSNKEPQVIPTAEPVVIASMNKASNVKASIVEPEVVEVEEIEAVETVEVPVKKVAVAESFITEPKVQVEIESKVEFEPNVETEVDVVDIEQGSQAQLSKVPSISVTSHIYSSQADRRSIVVNDQRLVEGDFVANQVQVNEITPQGMILEVDGLLFAVSRSRGWNR